MPVPQPDTAGELSRMVTLWQPPASLVAVGVKTSETRSWPAPPSAVGPRVGIHAAARTPKIEECPPGVSWRWVQSLPRGAVVAFATIVACHQVHSQRDGYALCVDQSGQPSRFVLDGFGDYSPGRWIWELADVETVDPPIPAAGRQRFWFCDIAAAAAAAANPACEPGLLERIVHGGGPAADRYAAETRRAAAADPNVPAETLERLLDDLDPAVAAAARNVGCGTGTLLTAP